MRTMEKRLWAFGSGGRGCVGRQYVGLVEQLIGINTGLLCSLATLEMKILIVTISWRYRTEIAADKEAQMVSKLDHKSADIKPQSLESPKDFSRCLALQGS